MGKKNLTPKRQLVNEELKMSLLLYKNNVRILEMKNKKRNHLVNCRQQI